jgi:23S rRNA-/tRNA-specific pseudouridylate synthase
MERGFQVLYEAGPCLVVGKPPGLLTQAPAGIDSLEVRIKAFLRQRRDNFGLHRRATRRLTEQFEGRLVRKVYWACVEGQVAPAAGTWEDYILKVPGEPRAEIVPPGFPDGRRAALHYKTIGAGPWGTWLEIELETGRTHQIRLQAASRSYPLLGDTQYGSTTPFGLQYEDERLRGIALHARSLAFRHPVTKEAVSITAPLWDGWKAVGIMG